MSQFKVVAEDVILPGSEEVAAVDTVVELDPSDEAVKALFDAGSIVLADDEEKEEVAAEDPEEEVAAEEPAEEEVAADDAAADTTAPGERHPLA